MKHVATPLKGHRARTTAAAVSGLAGAVAAGLIGVAIARTFTLQVGDHAKVTNQRGSTTTENIVVSHGFAVYTLTGDSKRHPKCTKANGCFSVWPPVTVRSPKMLSMAPGIRGKLGTWRRDGFFQLTLGGHPLYRFAPDTQRDHAMGEGITSFGGTWHVVEASASRRTSTKTADGTPRRRSVARVETTAVP